MRKLTSLLLALLAIGAVRSFAGGEPRFTDFVVNPATQHIQFHWKSPTGEAIRNFASLSAVLSARNETLIFGMNGGIYMDDPQNTPLGLYIQNGVVLRKLNTRTGYGNFYLKPNGVFGISMNSAAWICPTDSFRNADRVRWATQSGPMLVVGGTINPTFDRNSSSAKTRNGVGVRDDGRIVFSISTEPVTFYDFASHFVKAGCRNALYLDGSISAMYCPSLGLTEKEGNFGVMISVTE
jgi:uncharacterized protein YigE (DUF2233 family)